MTKEVFSNKIKELNLSLKEFSLISNISYSTITGWGCMANKKILPIPSWVEPFLKYYEKALKFDYVTDEICAKIKEVKG